MDTYHQCVTLVLASLISITWADFNESVSRDFNVSALMWRLLKSDQYNSRVRPGSGTGTVLAVNVSIFASDIYHISETDMEFSMTFYLRQRWRDPRLDFSKLYSRSITLTYNQFDEVWTPDIFIRNLKKGHGHDITVPNRLLRIAPDGSIIYSQRLTVTLSCEMHLERYPMDNQTCFINFGSYAYTTEDIMLYWDNYNTNNEPVAINKKIRLPKFELTSLSLGTCDIAYATTGAFPCLEAFFHLQRRLRSHIFYIYLPSVLVVILSWVSFWIDLHAVPARISLGILTILTIATQSTTVNRDMPSLSITKAVDVWMFASLVFVFMAFLEYSVVNVLSRRHRSRIQQTHSRAEAEQIAQRTYATEYLFCPSLFCDTRPDHDGGMPTRETTAGPGIRRPGGGGGDPSEHRSLFKRKRAAYEQPHTTMTTTTTTHPGDKDTTVVLDTTIPDDPRRTQLPTDSPGPHGRFCCNPDPDDSRRITTTDTIRIETNPALTLDATSRILFPSCFLLFNIIYWINYY